MQPNSIRDTSVCRDPDPEALSQMAQVLAHRLRGLLASIEGFTDLLADTLISRDQRELALKILEGTARIESVLSDLQLYGAAPRPVFLPVRVHELLTILSAAVSEEELGRVKLHVAESAAGRKLVADPYLIRQAILVLVQNALEATRRDESIRIDVTETESPRTVCVHVRNDGVIGVERAESVVFEPFYTTKAQNLGVGLSIARRIAELHEGALELTMNSVEDGVAFSLRLPLQD